MMTIAIPPRPEGRGILAKKSDEVKILIDPTFKNYSDINEFEELNIEDIDEEKAFVFKFKDLESLEHENIKEKIRAIEPR